MPAHCALMGSNLLFRELFSVFWFSCREISDKNSHAVIKNKNSFVCIYQAKRFLNRFPWFFKRSSPLTASIQGKTLLRMLFSISEYQAGIWVRNPQFAIFEQKFTCSSISKFDARDFWKESLQISRQEISEKNLLDIKLTITLASIYEQKSFC